MKPIHVIAACAVVLALTYGPVNAQDSTTMMNGGDKEDKDDDTWKRIAIILPIVFGGISMLILLWYCCCRAPHGGGWGCGECHCGSCCGGAYGDYPGCRCHNGECCGCQCGQCMGPGGQCCGDCCGAAPNGQCCPGCDMCCRGGACGVDCCRGCGGCGCDGCCPDGVQAGNQVYYSSSRGPVYASQPRPVVQVEDAYVYRSQPPADSSPYGGYTSNIGVNGAGGPYNPVYGGFRQGGYAGPASGGGCGCR